MSQEKDDNDDDRMLKWTEEISLEPSSLQIRQSVGDCRLLHQAFEFWFGQPTECKSSA